MTVTRAEVQQLLDLVTLTPRFERTAAAEDLVRAADASADDEMRFRARLELVESFFYATAKHRMFAPFAYLVRCYDAEPDWLTDDDRYRVLWLHKWMVVDLLDHPEISLEQLESVLDGMRNRYVAAGEGLAPVLSCAYVLHAHVHGAAASEAQYLQWRRAPRTRLSDCEGCEPDQRISHLAELGRHQDVVDELGPVVRGEVGCSEQPQRAVAMALASIIELGDVETAAASHRTAYRASRRNPGETAAVARHLEVLARTGNVCRGLDVLAEQLDALDRPSSPMTGMQLAAAATRLLRTVVDAGDGERLVRGRGREPERAVDVLARVESQAFTTARRFDERNGTTTVGDRVRGWIEAPDLPALPLGSTHPERTTTPPLDLPRVPAHPALQEDVDLDALDVAGLAGLAALAQRVAHRPTWDRLAAHWATRREAETAVGRARADLDAFCAASAIDPEPAFTQSAVQLYRELGDEAEAVLVELLGDLRAGVPIDPEPVLRTVDATGTSGQRALVRSRLAADAPDDLAERLRTEALDLLAATGELTPHDRGLVARLRLATAPDGPVLDLLEDDEEPDVRVQVLGGRAGARANAGDLPGTFALLDDAAAVARRAGAPALALHVEAARVRAFVAAGEHERAEAHAMSVAAAALDEDLADVAIDCRTLVAHVMARRGREVEAVELAESTLGIVPRDGAVPRRQRQHRTEQRLTLLDLASRLSSAMEESDRAEALAREAVELATGADGTPALACHALHRLAGLRESVDAVEATRVYAAALDAAEASGLDAAALVIRRDRIWARFDADGLDAALADLQGARTANDVAQARVLADPSSAGDLASWDFPWEDATLRALSAQLLEHAGEHQRALDALDGLPEAWEALGDGARALDGESLRGVALLEVGRDAEGLALLDDVAVRARAAGATQVSRSAAGSAAMWLDQAGRPEEAQAFWERHFGDDG
ncbi:hypothetical protein [Cellulomonas sp. Leaf334]|uniref:hypothetical protein n=1 Tax=Cellulomonas sp. Leaf334 TaxID=1736339 RepID=UPI0006FF9513|nr:hypothetical protein [Cellulomonas sp. Leaf334]KQR11661.1 hypothetical protein ASF78_10465 [Cellulomonas sp. Leaf334]